MTLLLLSRVARRTLVAGLHPFTMNLIYLLLDHSVVHLEILMSLGIGHLNDTLCAC
jgi:hypothetical protein